MRFLMIAVSLLAALASIAVSAQNNDESLIKRGKYIATAADCTACHGEDFAGGRSIANIYASNITPADRTGIGGWTETQFADALRKGRAPGKGWLYPAMPYTSYTGLDDDDVAALYAYLKNVEPIENDVTKTDLGFPFVRPAMMGWNLLNFDEGHSVGAVDVNGDAAERGRYLVETLGHCTTCHTPRGSLLEQKDDMHLAGASLGGWHAPNITSDDSGIGRWTDEELTQFLRTGHNRVSVASGEMGLAVERSLSKLPDRDIADIVSYLREVPPVETPAPAAQLSSAPKVDIDRFEGPSGDWQAMTSFDTTDGAVLYQGACASCHGPNGTGTAGPDLGANTDVRAPQPNNVVQVIVHGVNRKVNDEHAFMASFRDSMNNAQIASLANYVRSEFGGVEGNLDTSQVTAILDGLSNTPWLIQNAQWLAILAVVVTVLLLVLIIWAIIRAFGRRHVRDTV